MFSRTVLSISAAISEVFAQVAKDFGKYDIVVANSGVQQSTDCLTISPKDTTDIIDINFVRLDSPFLLSLPPSPPPSRRTPG